MKKLILVLVSFAFCLPAQVYVAKYAGEIMTLGAGARPASLGGAYSAIALDVNASVYNPAGLVSLTYPQLALMHEEKFGNLINYDYAAIALPYGTDMAVGVSVSRIGIEGIPDTRNSLYDVNGDGVVDILTDRVDYNKISYFNNTDYIVYFSGAKRINENLSLGANVKLIRRDIAEFYANGIGIDLAALYKASDNLSLAANLQDATTTLVSWSTGRNELVTPTLKLGAAYSSEIWNGVITPLADVDVRFENRRYASQFNVGSVSFDSHLGVEYRYKNLLGFRAGYNDIKELTFGIGVKLPKLSIDYSFNSMKAGGVSAEESFEASHKISLILTLEQPKFKRQE